MSSQRSWVALLAVAVASSAACSPADREAPPNARQGSLSVAESLGGPSPESLAGYASVLEPRPLSFPRDHGPHPDFRTEWWYWIGNLEAADGRRFGYQLTFFRSALAPPAPNETEREATAAAPDSGSARPGDSAWTTRQLYMAHLAFTDVEGGIFRSFERFSRGAAGLAGARAEPFRVWLDDWSVEQAEGAEQWLLRAGADGVRLELSLDPGKPRVLHGDRGFSRKGEEPGAASYYYSRTRMPVRGRILAEGELVEVQGAGWFDREWSTSLLAADEVGWDWLGAQLDDGRELMIFRLRRRDGSSARIDGTLVDAAGASRPLRTAGVELIPVGTWTSAETGIAYPAAFRIELPAEDLTLSVTPLLEDQELRLSFVYWEGAVAITGSATGRGYLEMTGYGERASPR